MRVGQIHHILLYMQVLAVPCSTCSTHLYDAKMFLLTQKSIIRATTTAVEVLLTFIRFTKTYKIQRVFGDGIRDHISHMQTSTRLLYVFYRDGTLLFIP